MCEICVKVKITDHFYTPKAHLECLKYIQALVDSGDFSFEAKDCDTDKVMNEIVKTNYHLSFGKQ